MSQPPPVHYVTTSDGYEIAYAVSGQGIPLLFLPGAAFYHVQLAWEYPRLQDWLQGLSERFQVIQLDPRGFGMSSREVGEDLARQHYQRDIEAVVGRLKLGPLLIVAASTGVDLAVDYTLQHSEQVIALVLGTSGMRWATALFDVLPAQDWDAFLYSLVPRDRSREEGNRIVELRRQSWDQRNYLLQSRVMYGQPHEYAAETEALLSRLRTPTLVLHSRDYALIPVEQGMKRAQIMGGSLVIIDGTDPWGDAEQGIRAIEAFLAELGPHGGPEAPFGGEGLPARSPLADTARRMVAKGTLSPRQGQVLQLIAQGKTNREIAQELVLSERTVQRHIADLYLKIDVRNRAEATSFALSRLA